MHRATLVTLALLSSLLPAAAQEAAPDAPEGEVGVVAYRLHTPAVDVWTITEFELRDRFPTLMEAVESPGEFVPFQEGTDEAARLREALDEVDASAISVEGTHYRVYVGTRAGMPPASAVGEEPSSIPEVGAAEEGGDPGEMIPGAGEGLAVVLGIFVALLFGIFLAGAVVWGSTHREKKRF